MTASTKNIIKLIVAAIFGFAFLDPFFGALHATTSDELTGAIMAAGIYGVIVAVLLFSVYRSNKKQV